MVTALIGRKLGMTQIFTDAGLALPVTVIQIEPNRVTQVKTPERDGYAAVQIGYGEVKRLSKAEAGHLKNLPRLRHLREVQATGDDAAEVGQEIAVDIFQAGDMVDVIGTSKGKGFAGTVKR